MNRIIPYLGPIGLGALVAGILLRLFQPHRDRLWASFLVAGLLLTVFYLATRWHEVMSVLSRRQDSLRCQPGLADRFGVRHRRGHQLPGQPTQQTLGLDGGQAVHTLRSNREDPREPGS